MSFKISSDDLKFLLQDQAFMQTIIKKALFEPDIVKELAEDLAKELGDKLKHDRDFKMQLISQMQTDPLFRKYLVKELADQLD